MLKSHYSTSQCRGARASYEATKSNSGVASREVSESGEVIEITEEVEEEEKSEEVEEKEAIAGGCRICGAGNARRKKINKSKSADASL
jgi:hypothetical protein